MSKTSPILDLLRRHHLEAQNPKQIIAAICQKCEVHQATVYRWMSGKVPSGEHMLNLVEYLRTIKEPQP